MSAVGQIHNGDVIDGKYRIVRLLGEGGMGAVYEGENTRIRRRVAIKMLHPDVSTQTDVVKRFEREAQAAALVGSEHICEVLDLGVLSDGTRYMVMEYLDGETLSGRLARHGRLTPAETLPIAFQVLEALGAAHAAGIIHRDLKPDNVFILPQRAGIRDFVKILDFGVSKFAQLTGDEMSVTRAGAVVGTPYYMSPEQARGISAVDARTDVYAIGVLLYQATTGEVPYQAETFNELLFKIALDVPPPPQTYVPDLDTEWSGFILKAMSRDPAQRFQSCAEFRDVLLAYQAARMSFPGKVPQPSWNALPEASSPKLDLSQQAPPSGNSWNGPPSAGAVPSATPAPTDIPIHTATSNAWGNASSSTMIPKSRAPMVLGIAAALLVGGGAAFGAFKLFAKPTVDKSSQASRSTTIDQASAVTASASIVSPALKPIEPVVPANTAGSTTAALPSDTPTAAVTASAAAKPSKPGRAGGGRPAPSAKASAGKPPVKPGNDLGY